MCASISSVVAQLRFASLVEIECRTRFDRFTYRLLSAAAALLQDADGPVSSNDTALDAEAAPASPAPASSSAPASSAADTAVAAYRQVFDARTRTAVSHRWLQYVRARSDAEASPESIEDVTFIVSHLVCFAVCCRWFRP